MGLTACVFQDSLEKQNHENVYIPTKLQIIIISMTNNNYCYKELAHVLMEADNSLDVQGESGSWGPGLLMV